MSKIVRLKQSDIEKIVQEVISEELNNQEETNEMDMNAKSKLAIGKDESGRIVVFNTETGDILGTK